MDYQWISTIFLSNRFRCCLAIIPLLLSQNLVFVLSSGNGERGSHRPVSYATKHISFPEFNSLNQRINHDLKFLGSANISSDRGSIQIPDTSGQQDISHQAGRVIYSSPVRLFDPNTETPASFKTTFSFQLYEDGSHGQSGDDGGSGLTFLIAPDEFTVGRPGAWLGMLNDACNDKYKFVAVEFDTRYNPEFGDPNNNHVGINLGSIVSTTTINVSDFGIELNDGSVHQAHISYEGERKWMDIKIASSHKNYQVKSVFSGMLDLGPYLKEYMFVGFSASTGNKTQIHSVLSWNFTSISPAYLKLPSEKTCQGRIMVNAYSLDLTKEKRPSFIFIIFVAVVALLFVALVALYITGKRRRKSGESTTSSTVVVLPEKKSRPQPPNKPRKFNVAELTSATKGFNEFEILTGDSDGGMYRGTLLNCNQVAVKRYSGQFLSSFRLDKKLFKERFKLLSKVKHPNLAVVRGWCYDKREVMVVYEYMFNGCLDKWLFGVGVLPWARRFKVIKHVAKGLSHLHTCQLAHRNVRVSSVYLDVDFKAVLGDFGPDDTVSESKMADLVLHQQGDVFDFGIFVLEMVAGRRRSPASDAANGLNPGTSSSSGSSAGKRSEEEEMMMMDLLDFAWMMHEKGKKISVVDQRMGSGMNKEQAIGAVGIGLLCTLSGLHGKPTMEEVLRYLNLDTSIPELPSTRPVVMFPYNSAPALALCASSYVCAAF